MLANACYRSASTLLAVLAEVAVSGVPEPLRRKDGLMPDLRPLLLQPVRAFGYSRRTQMETTRYSDEIDTLSWQAQGVPGDPEEPGVPDLPSEPGEPTIPDQPPPDPVA